MRAFATALTFAFAAPLFVAVAVPAAAEEAAAARLNLDTPVETIYADPAGAAVLEANVPGMNKHEMYDMFKAMSLRALAPMSQGMITEAMLTKIEKELAAIK
jgi:hypothetical protein